MIKWLRAQGIEFFVWILLDLWRFSALFRRKQVWGLQRKGRPILLVHGYLHSGAAWGVHTRLLMNKGLGPIYTIDLGHPFQSIRSYAKRVAEKARQIASETDRSDLILIGHSMGGLVSSYYATMLAPENTVSHVITLGSPLQGTHMAKIGVGECSREMEIGSDFLRELNQAIQAASARISFCTLATKTDQIILPYHSSLLEGAQRQFLIDDLGHMTLLVSPRVAAKVAEWIL